MSDARGAGYVSLNGEPYLVTKDPTTGDFVYQRSSTPKKAVQSTRRNASTGQSNLVEVEFRYVDGFGDETVDDARDTYHYAMNFFTEREGELVVLPGVLQFEPDTTIPSGATDADINLMFSPPVFVWEQVMIADEESKQLDTFFLGDHRAFALNTKSAMTISLDEDMFFEGRTSPTGGTVFNNDAYAAMGGGKRSTDRFIRRRDGDDGLWTNDDNNPLSIDEVSAAEVVRTTTPHGYLVGDVVYITASTITAFNGLWTVTAVGDTTHFTIAALASSGAAVTATVNVQDSDVKAEQLAIVGDEMVRTSYHATKGWQVSRVDIVGSNELLAANWTAGVGAVNVGDKYSTPTALIPVGNGELVMKPEGVFKYDTALAFYANEIPELEQHRHPDNGRGSFEYKGWVYIPTVIGLLRWKNGITQDVTPGRGGTQSFDSPIGPIGFMTGDANRMYAVTQPFMVNQPQLAEATIKEFGYNTTTDAPITKTTDVFDGDRDTSVALTGLTTSGRLYFGAAEQFHRIKLQFDSTVFAAATGGAKVVVEIWADTDNDGVGDAWVTRDVLYDGTRGWSNTDADPTTLHQTGDIVFGPLVHVSTGEPIWGTDGNLFDASLTAGLYWARLSISTNLSVGGVLEEVDFGLHVSTAFEPMHTSEIANDHGGVCYVLSMTEEQGRGVVWRTMWAFSVPDMLRDTTRYGGAQRIGACKIVQPGFLRSHITGDRYLFIGMQNISYLCPLGNHPDPTNQPYGQWYPYTGEGFDGGVRPCAVVLPRTDFGLASTVKVFKEIEFQTSGVDLSGVEIWYQVDGAAWVFAGYADDLTPNMPFVFTAGAEPAGYDFAVALSYEADTERVLKLDRFYEITLRAQPRPQMAETIRLTIELEYDQKLPGAIRRQSPHNAYAAFKTLQDSQVTVPFRNISGDTEDVHVLQVSQRASFNPNSKPKLFADLILAVGSVRTEAS